MPDSDKKVRAMTDANVLFSGTAFPRWPRAVLRHAADGDDSATLLAELADQSAFGAVHAQRYLGTVIGKRLERG